MLLISKPVFKNRIFLLNAFDDGKQTLGPVFVFNGWQKIFECVTLQPPWRYPNKPSRGPDGTFSIRPYVSPGTGKNVLLIEGTPGFSFIEFHTGNFITDTKACVLPGFSYQDLNRDGLLDVVDSGKAMGRLLELITEPTTITIQTLK